MFLDNKRVFKYGHKAGVTIGAGVPKRFLGATFDNPSLLKKNKP
jgi:hypothetical protein